MRLKYHIGTIIIGTVLTSAICFAFVMIDPEGTWPDSWPKELEPLRKQAHTARVATGILETVYVIPFKNRNDFEKAWPDILKVKSKGAPLILENNSFTYHISGTKATTGVMILAPLGGPLSQQADLPEYVVLIEDSDGNKQPVDARQFDDNEPKFRYRQRIDIILIADGKIVDLNRIQIPANTPIIDNRFKQ